jgi:hypothetical protein
MRVARLGNRITILTDPTARGIGGPAERAVAGYAQAAQFAEQERVDIAPWHDVIRNGCRRHSAMFQANSAQWFRAELGCTKAQPCLLFVERMRLRHQKSCTKRASHSAFLDCAVTGIPHADRVDVTLTQLQCFKENAVRS